MATAAYPMAPTAGENTSGPEPAAPCKHYTRQCRVLAECCKQWVGCRLCHNEQFADHEIDRHAIRQMQCLLCNTVQPCARECHACKCVMADYFCGTCNLFDGEGLTKKIFHCDGCGICRVGGRENYFHCDTCCGCYPHALNNKHRCLQDAMHRECAVCLEVTFASIESVNVLPCGHVLHGSCRDECVKHFNFRCPTCRAPMYTTSEAESDCSSEEDGNDSSDADGDGIVIAYDLSTSDGSEDDDMVAPRPGSSDSHGDGNYESVGSPHAGGAAADGDQAP